jgi:hypothetical protein
MQNSGARRRQEGEDVAGYLVDLVRAIPQLRDHRSGGTGVRSRLRKADGGRAGAKKAFLQSLGYQGPSGFVGSCRAFEFKKNTDVRPPVLTYGHQDHGPGAGRRAPP